MTSKMESAKPRPGMNCGSDHELLIAKFRLKLKKVEKIIKLTMLSEEAFQRAKKRSKSQRRKGKIYPFECRFPKNNKEREENLLK